MKKLLCLTLCACMALGSAAVLPACSGDESGNTPEPPKQEQPVQPETPKNDNFAVKVSVTADKIKINLSGKDEGMDGEYDVVAMKACEYAQDDKASGLSKLTSAQGEKIGSFRAGENCEISADRVKENFDGLYNKYYVTRGGVAVKGPFYATDIYSENEGAPGYVENIVSKKGVLGEIDDKVLDLGCSHVVLNFALNSFFVPNERVDENGETVPVENDPSQYYSFASNGTEYYFNKSTVDFFDSKVKYYSDNEINVIAIVYMPNCAAPDKLSYYKEFGGTNDAIMGYNTSNVYGMGYWTAAMEFFAERYSGGEKGYVSTFVIGNEIDFSGNYFCIHKDPQPLDVYLEEYARCLRLADLAVKKYNPDGDVCVTLTHSWVEKSYTTGWLDYSYAAKDILDKLNEKTKREGDYNWGITPHPYGYSLAATRIFEYDTKEGRDKDHRMTADYATSAALTFTNLEILDLYLNREEMKFNGKARSVYLTESGISSSGYYGDSIETDRTTDADDETLCQNIQAAAIAATWYKVSQLDCIKVYSYYRMVDNPGEGVNFTPGLLKNGGAEKFSYELWKYIDTPLSFEISYPYLKYITYYDGEGNFTTYNSGKFRSYLDILNLFGTDYDFSDFDYSKAMPVQLKPAEKSAIE